MNYAWYRGEAFGLMSYSGQGAGMLPTAGNVLRDLRCIQAGGRFMTNEACAPAQNLADAAKHSYYARTSVDADFPQDWVEKRTQDGGFAYIETVPVSVKAMHACAAENGAFIAGIQAE